MRKTDRNLQILYVLFGMALVLANVIAAKVFDVGISLFGSPLTITAGVLVYPMTFVITDVIGEIWGKQRSITAVHLGLICQVVATVFIVIGRYLVAVDPAMQDAYVMLLGQNWIFVIASLVAYWCSSRFDVFVFHKVRNAYILKHGDTKGGKWIWNNGSTIIGQFIDSLLFAGIAFGIGFGWLGDSIMLPVLVNMILAQWLFKVAVAVGTTPVFYFLTKGHVGTQIER